MSNKYILFFLFSSNVVSTYASNIEEIYQSFRKDKHHTNQNRSKLSNLNYFPHNGLASLACACYILCILLC